MTNLDDLAKKYIRLLDDVTEPTFQQWMSDAMAEQQAQSREMIMQFEQCRAYFAQFSGEDNDDAT